MKQRIIIYGHEHLIDKETGAIFPTPHRRLSYPSCSSKNEETEDADTNLHVINPHLVND